jgi:phosphoketolase
LKTRHPGKNAPALRSAPPPETQTQLRLSERAAAFRLQSSAFASWAAGYGTIQHRDRTQVRVRDMADLLVEQAAESQPDEVFELLAAADRIASAAMWLIFQMSFARRVSLEESDSSPADLKAAGRHFPSDYLQMALAYTGYLAANALTGKTRSWVMAQAHCAPAIEVVNLLTGNLNEAQQKRYSLDEQGLNRFALDFFPASEGAASQGGGAAELAPGVIEAICPQGSFYYYPHAPLKGERLVVFLGSEALDHDEDFAARWWRREDCGLIAPFLITEIRRHGDSGEADPAELERLQEKLHKHGYDPIDIRAGDPSAYAWAIIEMERRLTNRARAVAEGDANYPVLLPYTIAELSHGFGFSTRASREEFLAAAKTLFVTKSEIERAAGLLNRHEQQGRVREREHPLAVRHVPSPALPPLPWAPTDAPPASLCDAVDACFSEIAQANPKLRPRVGYAESRRKPLLPRVTESLKFRTTAPHEEAIEALHGAIISGVPVEAAIAGALANKGGVSLAITTESAAPQLLPMLRQEAMLAQQMKCGRPAGWLGIPLVVTSEIWEPATPLTPCHTTAFSDSLVGELCPYVRILFPADWNSTLAVLQNAYAQRGEISALLIPKTKLPIRFSRAEAERLLQDGAIRVRGDRAAPLVIVAVGPHQLGEAMRAWERLAERGAEASLVYLLDPGRFRGPRDAQDASTLASRESIEEFFPHESPARVFITHFRPEIALGMLRPLYRSREQTRALGFIYRDETDDRRGMLPANRCTWLHVLVAAAESLQTSPEDFLSTQETAELRA